MQNEYGSSFDAFLSFFFLSFFFSFFQSFGGWVKRKLKLPHFHVSDTCFDFTHAPVPVVPTHEVVRDDGTSFHLSFLTLLNCIVYVASMWKGRAPPHYAWQGTWIASFCTSYLSCLHSSWCDDGMSSPPPTMPVKASGLPAFVRRTCRAYIAVSAMMACHRIVDSAYCIAM